MSVSGLNQQYLPNTLDGLNIVEADQVYIDGQLVNLSDYVTYENATRTLNMGAQNIQTSHDATTGNDVVNKSHLDNVVSNLSIAIAGSFLDKVTATPQTVAGNVSYTSQLSADNLLVPTTKTASLGGVLTVDANYRRSENDSTVSVIQYFGSISSSMGIYQATSTQNYAILQVADLGTGTGKRMDINWNLNINEASYNSSIQLFASDNGTNLNQYLGPSVSFTPSDSLYKVMSGTFIPQYRYICVLCITAKPSGVQTVRWYGLQLDEQGVDITALTMSAQGANQIPIINDKKQLVGSGVSSTKVVYLDNVSSDIQTQLNSKLNLSGSNANQDIVLGGYKVQSSATPTTGNDLTNKAYVDGAIVTGTATIPRKADVRTGVAPNAQPGATMSFYFGTHANNNTTPFSDMLLLNGWTDSTAGKVNLISFSKGTSGGIRQYQGDYTSSSSFTDYYDCVMTDKNSSNVTLSGTLAMGANKVTSSATPTTDDDLTRKGYVDTQDGLRVLKSGDTMTATLYNSGGDFHAYRGGDTNRGCILTAYNNDGATYASNNGGLASWFGISFRSTYDNVTRYVFNTRDGNSSQTGTMTANAVNVAGQTASRVCVFDASKNITSSSVTSTTLSYLDIGSSLTSLLNAKGNLTGGNTWSGDQIFNSGTISISSRLLGQPDASPSGNFWMGLRGSASEVDRLAISINGDSSTGVVSQVIIAKTLRLSQPTANRVLTLDANGDVVSSSVTPTVLGYLDIGSSLSGLLNLKANLAGPQTFTGTHTFSAPLAINLSAYTGNRVLTIDASKNVTFSTTTTTELDYLSGTTSSVQSQLNAKGNLAGGNVWSDNQTFNGTVAVSNRLLGLPDSSPNGNFWIGLTGSGTEVQRLAISISGEQATGIVNSVVIGKPLELSQLTTDRVLVLNGSHTVSASSVTTTTLGYLDATSSVQTQLNNKVSLSGNQTINGVLTMNGIVLPAIFANRVVITNASNSLTHSVTTSTELGYLSGTTSSVQGQLNNKVSLSGNQTINGVLTMNGIVLPTIFANRVVITNASNSLTHSVTTSTELGYLSGTTSSVQGQLNTLSGAFGNYLPLSGGSLSGDLIVNGSNGITLGGSGTAVGFLGPRFYLGARGDNQDGTGADADGPWYGLGSSGIPGFTGVPCLAGYAGCALRSALGYVVLTQGGNVGIGTTNPTHLLEVSGTSGLAGQVDIGVSGNTVPNVKFANSLSHIDGNAGEVYLFTAYQGHMAIGRNTTRDATTANLVLGVASTEESQIVSSKTDNSGYLPLSFAASSYYFGSGNVGIGVPISNTYQAPLAKFTINSSYSGGDTGGFAINAFDGNAYNLRLYPYVQAGGQVAYQFKTYNQGTGYNSLAIGYNGFIGVGTTTPDRALDVFGASRFNNALTVSGLCSLNGGITPTSIFSTTSDYTNTLIVNTPWPSITFDNTALVTGGRKWSILCGGTGAGVGAGGFGIFDITANAYRLGIDTSGNATFYNWMKVQNGDISTCVYGPNTTWNARLRVGSGTSNYDAETAQIIATNGNLHLDPGYNKDFYLGNYNNNAGVLGTNFIYGDVQLRNKLTVGAETSRTLMSVSGGSNGGANRFGPVTAWDVNANGCLYTQDQPSGANSAGMFCGYNGANLSGYTTCLAPNVTWLTYFIYASDTQVFYNGALSAYTQAGGWVNVSDEREKEDIQDLKTDRSLARVMALKPKHYRRKYSEDSNTPVPQKCKEKRHVGFIAQEVQESNPHCVSTWCKEEAKCEEDDGVRLGMSYNDYVVHLVGAVQEQQTHIQLLQQTVEQLTAINEAQNQKINELESVIIKHNELLAQIVERLKSQT